MLTEITEFFYAIVIICSCSDIYNFNFLGLPLLKLAFLSFVLFDIYLLNLENPN